MHTEKEFLNLMKENGFSVLEVSSQWSTPATKYPLSKIVSAEIIRDEYCEGIYVMEGVGGYEFFWVNDKIPITILNINGKCVMTDDPLHEIGMEELGKSSHGKVLVGGLGLGLIVHALEKNPDVENVDVVEYNEDVIKLIEPLIPKTKTNIHKGDVLDEEWKQKSYDTIILDLWVKGEDGDGLAGIDKRIDVHSHTLSSFAEFKSAYPNSDVFIWGSRSKMMNPSIKKMPSKKYFEFTKRMEGMK